MKGATTGIRPHIPYPRTDKQARAVYVLSSSFSHPDCTVGSGLAPDPALQAFTPGGSRAYAPCAITAGREFHPAPKELYIGCYQLIIRRRWWSWQCRKFPNLQIIREPTWSNRRWWNLRF